MEMQKMREREREKHTVGLVKSLIFIVWADMACMSTCSMQQRVRVPHGMHVMPVSHHLRGA